VLFGKGGWGKGRNRFKRDLLIEWDSRPIYEKTEVIPQKSKKITASQGGTGRNPSDFEKCGGGEDNTRHKSFGKS